MQEITPFLWFDNQAEEAANFYVSVFKYGKIKNVARYGDAGPGPKGSVMMVSFEINGQSFVALDGGPTFKFTEAVSFLVHCKTQEEVDYYWDRLTRSGGAPNKCGWLQDKYGLSWQIIPDALLEIVNDPDPVKSNRVFAAMLKMAKIDIGKLHEAYAG